jgi:hypothetical protein
MGGLRRERSPSGKSQRAITRALPEHGIMLTRRRVTVTDEIGAGDVTDYRK